MAWNNGADSKFYSGDSVTFNGSATSKAVTISGNVAPSSVSVDTSGGNYTFSGTGSIIGSGSLTKTGTGTLVMTNANTYTGTTTVSGGTLQIGNGGTTGAITGSTILLQNSSALVYSFNNSGTASLTSGGIAGTGSVAVTAGDITLNGNVTTGGNQSYSASATGYVQGILLNAGSITLKTTGGASISLTGDIGSSGNNSNTLNIDTSNGNGTVNLDISVSKSGSFYNFGGLNVNAAPARSTGPYPRRGGQPKRPHLADRRDQFLVQLQLPVRTNPHPQRYRHKYRQRQPLRCAQPRQRRRERADCLRHEHLHGRDHRQHRHAQCHRQPDLRHHREQHRRLVGHGRHDRRGDPQ